MAKDRSSKAFAGRKENTREERKTVIDKDLLTFSFKYFDQTQPTVAPETLDGWESKKRLSIFCTRLIELSKLSRDEAIQQSQITCYKSFPIKSAFFHPKHVEDNVVWAVIKNMGGLPRVAGFIVESTFYVVFLDSQHQFWPSPKKHT